MGMDKFVLNVPEWQGELVFSKEVLIFLGVILLIAVGILFCFWGYKYFGTILFMGIGAVLCYGSFLLVEPMTNNSVIRLFLTVSLTFLALCFVYFLSIIWGFILDKLRIRTALAKRIYLLAAPLGAAVLGLTIYFMIWRDEIVAGVIAAVCLITGLIFQHSKRKKQVRFRSYNDLLKLSRPEIDDSGLEFISIGAETATVAAVAVSEPEFVEEVEFEAEPEPEFIEEVEFEAEPEPEFIEEVEFEAEPEPEFIEEVEFEAEPEPEFIEEVEFEAEPEFIEEVEFEAEPEPEFVEEVEFEAEPEFVKEVEFEAEPEPAKVAAVVEAEPEPVEVAAVEVETKPEPEAAKPEVSKPTKVSIRMESKASELEVDISKERFLVKRVSNAAKEKDSVSASDKKPEWKLAGGAAIVAFGLGVLFSKTSKGGD